VSAFTTLGLLMGCHDPTVWKKDVRSPDGAWVAIARTKQWGGFGSAWIETTVSIQKLDGTVNRGKPFDVLSYPSSGPIAKAYVLSIENADPDLKMTWATPLHLEIAHRTPIDPDLAVVRFADVTISFK